MRVVVNAAPIADAGPDLIGAPGQELTFVAAGSIDPDGDVAEYLWSFKDGAEASGPQVRYTFDQPGVYSVRLSVRDDTAQDKAIDYDEAKVVINAPPVARAGPDLRAAPGDAVTFDAGNSFDPDGEIATWRWDFSDQGEPTFSRQVVRAYAAPGVYTAQLTVTDDSGAINAVDRDEVEIRINHAPVASAGAGHRHLRHHGHVRRLGLGRRRRRCADLPLGLRRRHAAWRRRGGHPHLRRGRHLPGRADRRRRHRALATPPRAPRSPSPSTARRSPSPAATRRSAPATSWCSTAAPRAIRMAACCAIAGTSATAPTADIVNPTKTYDTGARLPGHADRPGRIRLPQRPPHRPDRGQGRRIADRRGRSRTRRSAPAPRCNFDGSASRDFDGVVNRFTWNFGDGTTGGGDRPVHVYSLPGDYRVVLTIEGDQAGQCDNTDTDETDRQGGRGAGRADRRPERGRGRRAATFDASQSSGATGQIALALGLRRRRHRRGSDGRARLSARRAPTSSGCRSRPMPPPANATSRRRSTTSSPTRRRSPMPARTAWSASTRRSCSTARASTRSRRRDHHLAVGLRRRHHRVRHERPPSLPHERPLSRSR